MGRVSHEPRERLKDYLQSQYERPAEAARELGCTKKAAENLLGGHWPNSRLLAAVVRRFGQDVVDAMFAPDIDATLARLKAEERELEDRLEAARARLRQVSGGDPGRPPSHPAPARRTLNEARL